MKTTKSIVAILFGAAALASCVKEAGSELPAPQDLITIKAELPGGATTKAGAHVGLSWYWNEGDKIAITGEEGTQIYNIKEGFTPKYAEFAGRPVAGESFTIAYPENAAKADWSGQIQIGNNSIGHLKYAAQLSDVNDYLSFSFHPDWAAEHEGTLKQVGVLKMVIDLPDTVTAVNGVTLAAEDAIFYKGNGSARVDKLELAVQNGVPDNKHNFVAWFTTSWNEAVVPAGAAVVVTVKTKGDPISKEVPFTRESVLMSGKVNIFNVDDSGWSLPSHYSAGKGTAEDPWIVLTAKEMSFMKDDLAEDEIRYFKLGADIDLSGVDWTPLNYASPYSRQIDFDGDGHTISNFTCAFGSYPSFFGVLYGKCHNVKFVNATINSAVKGCGVLGGYGGTTGKPCVVEDVHVQGSVISTAGNNVGGLFGAANGATIRRSSADVVIDSKGQMVGGLFGMDTGAGVQVQDCWTAGSISSTSSIVGGICGDLVVTGSSIVNCYSTASVTTQFIYGGIVGRAVAGQKSNKNNCTSQDPQNHIEYCIAWNDKLSSDFVPDTSEHYGSAAIVGQTAFKNYLVGGVRKADIDFSVCAANAEAGGYDPFDQEDASPENPMTPGPGNYAFGYHGKASAAGETLSQVARRIGWSADVWDFSGDIPKLK